MLRIFAKWWGMLSYRWQYEVSAVRNELNSKLAAYNTQQLKETIEQMNRDADSLDNQAEAIRANIKVIDKQEEERRQGEAYQKLSKQEQYEDDKASKKERDDALQMANDDNAKAKALRERATKEAENVSGGENAVKYHEGLAEASRATADKLKSL